MYRRPAEVLRRLLSREVSEPRALAYLMGACALMFVARLPALSREVSLSDPERWAREPGAYSEALQPVMGGTLLATLIFLPLIFYVIAFVVQIILRAFGRKLGGYDMRLVLFWSLLAAAPLALLNGLTAGFVGPGPALTIVGVLWFAVLLWFVATGVREAHRLAGESA